MATKPKTPASKPQAKPTNTSKPVVTNKPAAISKPAVVAPKPNTTSKPIVSTKPASTTTTATKTTATPSIKSAISTAAKPVNKVTVKPVAKKVVKKDDKKSDKKDDKKPKADKIKMERDSFTMPKDEYAQIALLKARLNSMGRPAKKSELLRAGIKLLATMSDNTLKTTMEKIPTIKTGRPKK